MLIGILIGIPLGMITLAVMSCFMINGHEDPPDNYVGEEPIAKYVVEDITKRLY